jgi:hypothetical protein
VNSKVMINKRNLAAGIFVVSALVCLAKLLTNGQADSGPAVGGFVFFDEEPLDVAMPSHIS